MKNNDNSLHTMSDLNYLSPQKCLFKIAPFTFFLFMSLSLVGALATVVT